MHFVAEPLAEDALLLRFGDRMDTSTNANVHQAARALHHAKLTVTMDIAPAYATLLIRFDPFAVISPSRGSTTPHDLLLAAVHSVLDDLDARDLAHQRNETRLVEVPVCYSGDFGEDIAELAQRLQLVPQALIERHTAPEYTVAMLGFAPGFPYLLGLDPALETPRRATPRTRVPAGSVAIGGAQTGIYPRELPGGWNLIGRTPLVLFDPRRENPALLSPGDRVRFRAIHADEFAALAGQAS